MQLLSLSPLIPEAFGERASATGDAQTGCNGGTLVGQPGARPADLFGGPLGARLADLFGGPPLGPPPCLPPGASPPACSQPIAAPRRHGPGGHGAFRVAGQVPGPPPVLPAFLPANSIGAGRRLQLNDSRGTRTVGREQGDKSSGTRAGGRVQVGDPGVVRAALSRGLWRLSRLCSESQTRSERLRPPTRLRYTGSGLREAPIYRLRPPRPEPSPRRPPRAL